MKQVSSLAKGTLNLCRAYLNWVNQLADNHKISEKALAEMVSKGRFKTMEEAEHVTKRTIKVVLIAAPVVFLSILTVGTLSKPVNQSVSVQTPSSSTPAQPQQSIPSPSPSQVSQQPKPTTPIPESRETSIGALVQKKGSDFSYEASGRVQETEGVIVVNYSRSWECGEGARVGMARQEWKTTFNLSTKTWTDQVRELSSCLGNPSQEWTDYSTNPSQFSIQSNGNDTILRANAQDTDGSVIVKDSLVVKYTRPSNSAPLNQSATSQTADKTLPSTRTVNANDGYANLRSQPSTEVATIAKVPNGTSVAILEEQTNSSGQLWYKVQVSGQSGWIYSEILD